MACPTLYNKVWDKMYNIDTGYEPRIIGKWKRTYKKLKITELQERLLTGETRGNKKDIGGEKDLITLWKEIYQKKGWSKYARFNPMGKLNEAYVLLKHKNVIDPTTRPDTYTTQKAPTAISRAMDGG